MNSTRTKSVPTSPRLCAPGQLQWDNKKNGMFQSSSSDWWSDFVWICRWVFGKGGYFIVGIMISQSRWIRSIGWIQLQYPKGLDEIWNIPVRWLDASSNSKNRRNHQTEAGGHFLVELSAYLACRAPRLALDVFTPSKWAGHKWVVVNPRHFPECGLGNSVCQVSHVEASWVFSWKNKSSRDFQGSPNSFRLIICNVSLRIHALLAVQLHCATTPNLWHEIAWKQQFHVWSFLNCSQSAAGLGCLVTWATIKSQMLGCKKRIMI